MASAQANRSLENPRSSGAALIAASWHGSGSYAYRMCRNITTLRGLEPEATKEEVEAAARQYVRKVSGVQKPSARTEDAIERAVRAVAEATTELLSVLPPRQQPPPTLPPLRRLAARA